VTMRSPRFVVADLFGVQAEFAPSWRSMVFKCPMSRYRTCGLGAIPPVILTFGFCILRAKTQNVSHAAIPAETRWRFR
jgi:hypothetical protein